MVSFRTQDSFHKYYSKCLLITVSRITAFSTLQKLINISVIDKILYLMLPFLWNVSLDCLTFWMRCVLCAVTSQIETVICNDSGCQFRILIMPKMLSTPSVLSKTATLANHEHLCHFVYASGWIALSSKWGCMCTSLKRLGSARVMLPWGKQGIAFKSSASLAKQDIHTGARRLVGRSWLWIN